MSYVLCRIFVYICHIILSLYLSFLTAQAVQFDSMPTHIFHLTHSTNVLLILRVPYDFSNFLLLHIHETIHLLVEFCQSFPVTSPFHSFQISINLHIQSSLLLAPFFCHCESFPLCLLSFDPRLSSLQHEMPSVLRRQTDRCRTHIYHNCNSPALQN